MRCSSGCLRSLADDPRLVTWVVDNTSSDGSADMVRERFPDVTLVTPDVNLGFGRAVNLVATRSRTPWFVCANADTALTPGALDALLAAAARDPRAGALAPRLVGDDGGDQHSAYPFPGLRLTVGFALGALRGGLAERLCLEGHWDARRERRVPWAIGAFLLLRREAWLQAGGFDPRQWLYAEDLDLGWRLRRAGWATRHVPAAVVLHTGAAATSQRWGAARDVRWQTATYDWLARRRSPTVARTVAVVNVLGAASRWWSLALRQRLAPTPETAWRRDRWRAWMRMHRDAAADALDENRV